MVWNKKIKQEARRNRFKAWLILSLAVFLSLSFYSYNPQDSSLNSFGLSLKVTNYCGFVGASLADLFYQMFGFSSWFFILGALWLSYKFFTNRFHESLISFFLLFGLFLLSFSGLSELHFPEILFFQQKINLGGALGKIIVAGFKPLFHTTGTAVLLWSAFLLIFVFYGQALFPISFLLSFRKNLFSLINFSKKLPVRIWFLLLKSKKLSSIFSSFLNRSFNFLKENFLFLKDSFFKKAKKEKQDSNSLSSREEKAFENKAPDFVFKEKSFFNEEKDKEAPNKATTSVQREEIPFKKEASVDFPIQKKQEEGPPRKERAFISAELPSLDILSDSPISSKKISRLEVEDLSKKLIDKLSQFSIHGEITAVKTGPAVVLFEFKPEDHVKVSRIREMGSDLSLALSSESVRIIAPIPGRDVVGLKLQDPIGKWCI